VASEGVTWSAGVGVTDVEVVGVVVGAVSATLGVVPLGAIVDVLDEPQPVIKTPASRIVTIVVNSVVHLCLDIITPPFS